MSVVQPVIPILALPSVVLYPHALCDLDLTGEHFALGVGEWLAEDAVWGIATERRPAESYADATSIFRTLGVGRIIHRESDKGMLQRVVIEGMARGFLSERDRLISPGIARVEILRDRVNVEGDRRKELASAFGDLVRTARNVAMLEARLRDPIRRVLNAHPHPGVVADLLAHHCVEDLYARQCLLEELDVGRRVRLVHLQLAQRIACHAPYPMRRQP